MSSWTQLGIVSPSALRDARLELHWALQNVSAIADACLPHAEDDSHASTEWLAASGVLAHRATEAEPRFRAGLRVPDLSLVLLNGTDREHGSMPLAGRTLDEGLAWLTSSIAERRGGDAPAAKRRDYAMPDHPAGHGKHLPHSRREPFQELARWFGNASSLIGEIVMGIHGSSPVRCWPHHFDMAGLVPLEDHGGSVGIGMSPGDEYYDEPYFYVTPPESPVGDLPRLDGGGHWHTEEFTGAILLGSRLTQTSAADQARQTRAFIDSAMRAAHME